LLAVVGGEVGSAEVDIGFCEAARVEAFFVRLARVDSACAPAGVYKVPVAVVEAAGVPCVVGFERWNSVVWSLLLVVAAFASASYDNGFKADFHGESRKQASVSFAHG